MHGGDIYSGKIDIDLSINTNPLGMPASFKEVYENAFSALGSYPDLQNRSLRKKIGDHHGVDCSLIVCGNGASELIQAVCYAFRPSKGMITAPSFSGYERALKNAGCEICVSALKEEDDYRITEDLIGDIRDKKPDIVFVANPNNPNGKKIDRVTAEGIIEACRASKSLLVIDECFVELTKEGEADSLKGMIGSSDKALIIRSFTKAYAIPGIRLGYAVCSDEGTADTLRKSLPEWNISTAAELIGEKALEEVEYLERGREEVTEGLDYLRSSLESRGMKVYPSDTAYILFRTAEGKKADLYEKMKENGLLIRDCSDYRGLAVGYYRVAVRSREISDRFFKILDEVMFDE